MTVKTCIFIDEAIDIILGNVKPLPAEQIDISAALGRTLAADVIAQREHPPWNNSAMDGYAVRWRDINMASPNKPVKLKIIGEIQAGSLSASSVNKSEALKIMTGAPMPKGADSVVKIEDTEQTGDIVTINKSCKDQANVRFKGEDIRLGETVLTAGKLIRPAEIGMLATSGYKQVQVYKQATVTVLATGNELVEPSESLTPEKIINSNTYSIAAQIVESGGIAQTLPIAEDNKDDLTKKISRALQADITIVLGGVSAGKYDYVKDVLETLGCDIKFWRVLIKPGFPIAFGIMPKKNARPTLVFALPGNPVSCMVTFYQFIRPVLYKMQGMKNLFLPQLETTLDETINIRPGRRHYARAITHYKNGVYHSRLTGVQGSGILTSMTSANSLLIIPETGGEFKAGCKMQVQLLPGTNLHNQPADC